MIFSYADCIGAGLELTQGNCLILMHPEYDLAKRDQLIYREYRIGQIRDVYIFKLYGKGVLAEENIMQKEKSIALFNTLTAKALVAMAEKKKKAKERKGKAVGSAETEIVELSD